MKYKNNFKLFILLPIVSVFMIGCNSDGPEIEQPEKIYYDQAQRRMATNNYFGAIESLEAIETRYPFGKYAEQAQVELVYAYFMKGLSSYTRDNSLIQRLTETDLSNRDVSGAKQSFSELTEFLTRYPESQYAPYAKQRNIYLRNMIARNELAAADYYLSIDAHVAAIRRAKYVMQNIPNSSENYRALKVLEKSYKALGYSQLYEDVVRILNLNYSEENVQETDDSGWSWNFLRNSKPETQN